MKPSTQIALAALLLFSGAVHSAHGYQPPVTPTLAVCATPLSIFLSDGDTALNQLVIAKGHRVVTSSDLLYSAKKLKRGDFVFAINQNEYNVWFNEQAKQIALPTTMESYVAKMLQDENESSLEIPLIRRAKLEEGMTRLAELDEKRGQGKLSKEEAAMKLESFFSDLFISDAELAKASVKVVTLFEPRMAIPYHQDQFALEEGYGENGKQNGVVVGIEINGLEYKRRVLESSEIGKKTLGELSENHVMSEAGVYAMALTNALNGQILSDLDFAKLRTQAIAMLPRCENSSSAK